MRCRVVCALREVMLTFWPTSAFINVDLPTLGRPTIAIMPQWKSDSEGAFIEFSQKNGTGHGCAQRLSASVAGAAALAKASFEAAPSAAVTEVCVAGAA